MLIPLLSKKAFKESQKNHLKYMNALTAEFLLKLYYVKYEAEKYIIAHNCETYWKGIYQEKTHFVC